MINLEITVGIILAAWSIFGMAIILDNYLKRKQNRPDDGRKDDDK